MKILILQENGRHDANRKYRECFNFHRAFSRIGIESVVWGLNHENFSIPFNEIIKGVDAILLLENYEVDGWIPNLADLKIFKIFLSIDSHCTLFSHINTVNRHNINLVLNAIESHQIHFKGRETAYFSNAYPSDLIFPLKDVKKDVFLGFCGSNFEERNVAIQKIENKCNIKVKKDIWVLGDEMVKKINSYKVHYNRTISNDINYRVFETMGCNTLSLTNETENITKLFKDMENIVIYKNENELYEKINFLNSNPNEIQRISNNGHEYVSKNHTFDNRAKEIINLLKNRL